MPCAPLSNAISLMQRSPPCLPIEDSPPPITQRSKPRKWSSLVPVIASPALPVIIDSILRRPGSPLDLRPSVSWTTSIPAGVKRNVIDYDAAFVATDTEAEEILKEANAFRKFVEQWINSTHPGLAKT